MPDELLNHGDVHSGIDEACTTSVDDILQRSTRAIRYEKSGDWRRVQR
jgi:hypothetical protein